MREQQRMDVYGISALSNYTAQRQAPSKEDFDVPTSLELFAGGGGMALGLHRAGFTNRGLVEFEPKACDTLVRNAERWATGESNDPAWNVHMVHCADVRHLLTSDTLAGVGDIDLLAGGPPCQPFSLGGEHRGDQDSRNMFPAALDYVRELRPRLVVFENVPGLTRPSLAPYFDYVEDQLRRPTIAPKTGETWREHAARLAARRTGQLHTRYHVTRQIIDSANLGVPQSRRRVFLMGVRADLMDGPVPEVPRTHSAEALAWAKWVEPTYWAEHDLPEPPRPDGLTDARLLEMKKAGPPSARRWRTVRDAVVGLPEPVDGRPAPGVLNHTGVPGARSYAGHTGSAIDSPSKTIKAGVHGVCGGEAMIRFDDDTLRYLTVRESARVQTFPDDYEFVGARSHAMRHIGNAVAVAVAEAVGRHLREHTGV
ncbi:DNA (cytosine-5-)-methyltransferase [soil metagenome]